MENLSLEDAVVYRKLYFICGASKREIVVAIGKPYYPAKEPAYAAKNMAACIVLKCEDTSLGYEVFGKDKYEALEMALLTINDYLRKLASDPNGLLQYYDGTPFDPDGSEYMRIYKEL